MRMTFTIFFYAAAGFFIWSVYGTPEWEALSVGFPHTDREYGVAAILAFAMVAKLAGHVTLLSSTRSR